MLRFYRGKLDTRVDGVVIAVVFVVGRVLVCAAAAAIVVVA